MKVPLRWLQEFIELPTTDPAELSDVLTMLGHEVESFEVLEPGWTGVFVGRVERISPHPDADKVRVCQVDTGSGTEQIICGAWNFSDGAYVAVAQPGAVLPGDFEISQRTIRGVESNGMICSESELGLGEDHSGILVLDGEPALGSPFSDLVELPDVVFDLAITSNRPDAMSLVGIARDLAAHYAVGYQVPERPLVTAPGSPAISVEIGDPSGCRRFTAREIRGVRVGSSPLWVRHRLRKAGMRAISNVVDVTNYVMLELGHPLHAFDADTISGGRLTVKRAEPGETLETLDGELRSLTAEDLIIYDSEGPTSMSGTMGGARSEVSESTVNVLMEAASWDPPTIMYMSRRHGLMSEASTRFERGVDPNLTERADARAAAMVVELGGGEVLEAVIDEIAVEVNPVQVDLTLGDVERLLGPGFTIEQVSSILTRLGMSVAGTDPMVVTVPTYRPDVTRPADLVEEVARLHGFQRFGATLPTGPGGGLSAEQKRARLLTSALVGLGMHQTVTLPFVNQVRPDHAGMDGHGSTAHRDQPAEGGGRDHAADHAPRSAQRGPSQFLVRHVGGRLVRDVPGVPRRALVRGLPAPRAEIGARLGHSRWRGATSPGSGAGDSRRPGIPFCASSCDGGARASRFHGRAGGGIWVPPWPICGSEARGLAHRSCR